MQKTLALILAIGLMIYAIPQNTIAQDTKEGQTTHKTLTIPDILKIKSFSSRSRLQLSPDGEFLAYVVQDPHHKSSFQEKTTEYSMFLPTGVFIEHHSSAVWVTNIRTKETYKLGSEDGVDWAPRWSPDGRYLAFYSDRMGAPQLWVWDKMKNKMRRISEKPITAIYGFEAPQWTSDGKHLIAKLRPEDIDISRLISPDTNPQTINVWETETYEPSSLEGQTDRVAFLKGDLAVFDFDTGDVSILTSGLYTTNMFLSPDNAAVAVIDIIGTGELTAQEAIFELLLVPLDGTPVQRLATGIKSGSRIVSWAPDGKQLVYGHPDGLFLVSVQDGEQKNLTVNLAENPRFSMRPLWSPSGTSIFCGFDGHVWELTTDGSNARKLTDGLVGRGVFGVVAKRDTHIIWQSNETQSICIQTRDHETKKNGFYLLNTTEGGTTCLFEEPLSIYGRLGDEFDIISVGCGGKIVYRAQNATQPEEIWMLDTNSGKRQQVSDLNPHLRDLQFGEVRLVESKTAEGQLLQGVLMLPVNYEEGKRYPLVTWVYGGRNLSGYAYRFGLTGQINFQLLATRGYAVLGVDTPLKSNDPMIELSGFVLPAVDNVIEMGIADENRLGIIGYSYGGYSTVGLITQTNRFKAAVSGGGLYNLTSHYGILSKQGNSYGIGWSEGGQGRMRGSLWEQRQRYIDNSPIFHLDKVETPVLIYCGEGYDGNDYTQSGELFSGLRRLKKKATFVWYRGEGHGLTTWRAEHRADCWERIIDWFEKHLN